MALVGRRGRKPETVFQSWTDLNSLVRRQLDPEDMKAAEMEAHRLDILHSQVSNSGDKTGGSQSRTNRMKEIFEYKSLHLSTSPQPWCVPSGHSSLVVVRVGRAEGEVLRLDMCSENLNWEEGLLPETEIPSPSLNKFDIKQLQPSGHWVLDVPEKDAKCCLASKEVTLRMLQQLEEEERNANGGLILVTLWEEDLAYLFQMASKHGAIARLRRVLSGVTSVQNVWSAVNERELQPGDLSKDGAQPSAESGLELLKLILDENTDIASHSTPLHSVRVNKLLCSALHQHNMKEFSESVSTAVLVNPLSVEAGRMAVVTLSVRPELRGHGGSQYDLSLLAASHKTVFSFGTEVLSSSGQGRLTLTLTNIQTKKVKMAAGSVFGLVKRIDDLDTELENEKLRGGESQDSEEELMEDQDNQDNKVEKGLSKDDESDNVMISLDLLRETLTKELQARDSDKRAKPTESDEVLEQKEAPSQLRKEKPCDDKLTRNTVIENPLELNQFIDFEGPLANKDMLTELNDLQSDLEISNWDDLNSALEGIDMATDFDIIDFSENPLSTLPSVAEDINASPEVNTEALPAAHFSALTPPEKIDDPSCTTSSTTDQPRRIKKSSLSETKRRRRPLSRNKPLVVQLASIKAHLESPALNDEDLEEQFPSVLGQQQFAPLLQSLVSYAEVPMPMEFEFTDFGDKMILELQSLDVDTLDDLLEAIKLIHQQNPTASLVDWESMFAERFEHFRDINDMLGDRFDAKVIQLLLLHFADQLLVSDKLERTDLGMVGFCDKDMEPISDEIIFLGPNKSCFDEEPPEPNISNPILEVPLREKPKSDETKSSNRSDPETTHVEHSENETTANIEPTGSILDGILPDATTESSSQSLENMSQDISVPVSESSEDQQASPKDEDDVAPLNPGRDMDKIFLGVTDEFVGQRCKIMALNGEDPFYATFSSKDLIIKGRKVDSGQSVKDTLAENDDDLILVQVAGDLSVDEDPICEVAIPLSSWTDGRHFFDGLVLFHDLKDEVRVAFLQEDKMKTLQVTKEKIKMFDTVTDLKCLEPGLEVKLLVQKIDDKFEATICVPNPEKKFYDLLEISSWVPKTRRHMTDPDTQSDIIDSFKNQVIIKTVLEDQRQFLLIRASTKKMASQVAKLVQNTKKTFEKIPGMKPKVDASIEVFMEFLPESLQATEKFLEELIHVSHYTGTQVSLVDGEVLIEGRNYPMVLLARDILNHNIGLAIQNPVLGTSSAVLQEKKQAGELNSVVAPKRIESRVNSTGGEVMLDDNAEVSSTTDGNDPQLDCSLGKEVGEGRVVEIREVPNQTEVVKVKEVETSEKDRNQFNIILESQVVIKAKSVVFADAVVHEADKRILGQVHEIQRHPEFKNSDIFVPENQKKKITDEGKLKVSLRNKTESDKRLDQGTRVCQISIVEGKLDRDISKSETNLTKEVPRTEKEHNPREYVACLSESDIEIIEDDDICIVEEVKSFPGKCVDDNSKKPDHPKDKISQEEKIVETAFVRGVNERKPRLPQQITVQSQKTDQSSKTVIEKPPCNHVLLEEEACPKALLSGGDCKLVNCSGHLQHIFPKAFLESLRQEFCLRHLRNKVCTRALPPFLCSSRQHVESSEPVLAFYKDYRYRVHKNCPNCRQNILEPSPSEQEKVVSQMEKTAHAQTTAGNKDSDGGKGCLPKVILKRSLRDFCGHIKFRMKLCKVRDKAKCPIAGCPDVHAINDVLKIQFCNDYLEDPSQCKKISCLPHFNLDELQERYHLAIRARVLNCSKCIFRCKHFNLANVGEKKPRPCADDFAGKCQHEEEGLVVCTFVHKEEVQHLDLVETNSTLAEYEQAFFKSLAACKGFCKTCRSEMEEAKKNFEKKTRMEVFKTVELSRPAGSQLKTTSRQIEGRDKLKGGDAERVPGTQRV